MSACSRGRRSREHMVQQETPTRSLELSPSEKETLDIPPEQESQLSVSSLRSPAYHGTNNNEAFSLECSPLTWLLETGWDLAQNCFSQATTEEKGEQASIVPTTSTRSVTKNGSSILPMENPSIQNRSHTSANGTTMANNMCLPTSLLSRAELTALCRGIEHPHAIIIPQPLSRHPFQSHLPTPDTITIISKLDHFDVIFGRGPRCREHNAWWRPLLTAYKSHYETYHGRQRTDLSLNLVHFARFYYETRFLKRYKDQKGQWVQVKDVEAASKWRKALNDI